MPKNKPKAVDSCRKWLKENCKKGEVVEILASRRVFIITKTNEPTFAYQFKWDDKKSKKKLKASEIFE